MVEIKKGTKILTIPAGALSKYASTGWELIKAKKSAPKVVEDEFEEEIEYVDPEELAEKPLNELDKEELKILAEYKGLDTKELTTAKKLRAALGALE